MSRPDFRVWHEIAMQAGARGFSKHLRSLERDLKASHFVVRQLRSRLLSLWMEVPCRRVPFQSGFIWRGSGNRH